MCNVQVKLGKLEFRAKMIILDDYVLQIMKTPNSKSQKMQILHEINKQMILNTEMLAL